MAAEKKNVGRNEKALKTVHRGRPAISRCACHVVLHRSLTQALFTRWKSFHRSFTPMHAARLAIRSSPWQKLTATLRERYKLRKINESSNDIAGKICKLENFKLFCARLLGRKTLGVQASEFTDVLWFHDSENFSFRLYENFKNRLHESLMSAASDGTQIVKGGALREKFC